MNKGFKEKILELRKNGKKVKEIQEILGCSFSTISYHLYRKTKESTKNRNNKNRKKYNITTKSIVSNKYIQFFRRGHRNKKEMTEKLFSMDDIMNIIESNPKCYLTGEILNFSNPQSFSLDHKIPVSKGGSNELNNLGICSWKINRAKSDSTIEEFIELCKKVLINQGYTIHGGRNGS